MKKNPVVPYILIFSLGLGLIFFLSLYGIDQKKEITAKDEGTTTEENAPAEGGDQAAAEDFDPAAFLEKSCVSCHGGDLTGGMGPGLVGSSLSKEDMSKIIKDGKNAMPAFGSQLSDEQINQLSEYILTLK